MNYIIEAVLVGIYSVILYLLSSIFTQNLYILLLVCGFCKHLLGGALGIHEWYCKYKFNKTKLYKTNILFIESLLESLLYLFVGITFNYFIVDRIILFFMIGFLLHILFEILTIHKYFCYYI